jgi:biotin operon repressor
MNKNLNFDNKKDFNGFNKSLSWSEYCSNLPPLPSVLPRTRRIVVVGDLHGDWNKMIDTYIAAVIIPKLNLPDKYTPDNYKEKLKWIGSDTIVVQVGDQIDSCRITNLDGECNYESVKNDIKGANDLDILEFNTYLHHLAQTHKDHGALYSLLGNHEIMNVEGDFRYVSEGNLRNKYKGIEDLDNVKSARLEDFKPGSKIASFLGCTRQAILKIGRNLFVHGGVVSKFAKKYKIKEINEVVRNFLLNKLSTNDKDSDLCEDLLKDLKEFWQVGNVLVGHTPQMEGIAKKCDNRIIFTDYGSSHSFNTFRNNNESNVQYLEILHDKEFYVCPFESNGKNCK